jgi:hypothetical protein
MREFHFRLNIPAHEYLAYYQGAAREVLATSAEGVRVRFPASALRPFVTHGGVSGAFVLRIGADNKLQALEKVGD